MTLSETLDEYVRACFSGIWIQSHEHADAIQEIAELCRRENWRMASWDIDQGLQCGGATTNAPDPLAAVRSLPALAGDDDDAATLLVLQNFHRFLNSPEIVQAIAHAVIGGKQTRCFVVVLAPLVNLPVELEKLFVVLQHELPGKDQLERIAREVATEADELPSGSDLQRVLDAASGLTRLEAETAFALSLVRHRRIDPSVN